MNKLNKELLERALVEGVDDSCDGFQVSLASGSNDRYNGFHITVKSRAAIYWQYVCTKEEYLATKADQEGVKAVMGVINKYKGEWGEVKISLDQTGEEIVLKALVLNEEYPKEDVGFISRGFEGFNPSIYQFVCNKHEFEQCVKDCSTNFGKSSLKHLNIWQKGIEAEKKKLVPEIDWINAPEGATHHIEDTDNGSQTQFVRYSKKGLFGEAYYCIDNEGGHWSLHVEDDEVYILTQRPAQPVFTQAMADAGELPQVGGVFTDTSSPHQGQVTCLLIHEGEAVYKSGTQCYQSASPIECKPIDTRTEKEKAIDEFTNEMAGKGYENSKLISLAYDKWVGK